MVFDGRFLYGNRSGGIARDAKSFAQEFIANEWSLEILRYGKAADKNSIMNEQAIIEARGYKIELAKTLLTGKPIESKNQNSKYYFQSQVSPIYVRNKDRNLRSIVRVHDLFPITNPEWFQKSSVIHFKKSLSKVRDSTIFVPNSISTMNTLKEYFGSKSEDFLYFNVPCYSMIKKNSVKCGVCKACMMDIPTEKYLLMVGTIEPRKNYVRFIEAWGKSNIRKNISKLVIIGQPGWKYEDIKSKILETDNVHWIQDSCDYQLNEYYKKCNIFVSASLNEGYDIPLDEARFYKKQTILSDIEVHKERIGENSSLWFDPQEVDSIVTALNEATTDIPLGGNQILNANFSLEFKKLVSELGKTT